MDASGFGLVWFILNRLIGLKNGVYWMLMGLVWFGLNRLIGLKNGMYWMLIVLVCRVWIDWFEELYVIGMLMCSVWCG